MNESITNRIFNSMRFGRKYSAGFISCRQDIPLSTVRASLASLLRGGVITVETSTADKRRKLYISKQQQLGFADA